MDNEREVVNKVNLNEEYEKMLKQLVMAKLEYALEGKEMTFSDEEYSCFKAMITKNPNLVRDSGVDDVPGNYTMYVDSVEYNIRDSDDEIVATDYNYLIGETISIKMLNNYLNIVYDRDHENASVSFDSKCATLRYDVQPTNFTREDEFLVGMQVERDTFLINELEAKVEALKKDIDMKNSLATKEEKNVDSKYDELLRQIVATKLELALSGSKFELSGEEYDCLKTMISESTDLIEDGGSRQTEGNYTIGASYEELQRVVREKGRLKIEYHDELSEECISIMILGNYLNINYGIDDITMSLDSECGTLQYGKRPTNYIGAYDFLETLPVEWSELTLEELEQKKKEFDKNELDVLEIVGLASEKRELELDRRAAQELLREYEELKNTLSPGQDVDK